MEPVASPPLQDWWAEGRHREQQGFWERNMFLKGTSGSFLAQVFPHYAPSGQRVTFSLHSHQGGGCRGGWAAVWLFYVFTFSFNLGKGQQTLRWETGDNGNQTLGFYLL